MALKTIVRNLTRSIAPLVWLATRTITRSWEGMIKIFWPRTPSAIYPSGGMAAVDMGDLLILSLLGKLTCQRYPYAFHILTVGSVLVDFSTHSSETTLLCSQYPLL